MTRLYMKGWGDGQFKRTMSAHQTMKIQCLWGDKNLSMLACEVEVKWPLGNQAPVVTVRKGEHITALALKGEYEE